MQVNPPPSRERTVLDQFSGMGLRLLQVFKNVAECCGISAPSSPALFRYGCTFVGIARRSLAPSRVVLAFQQRLLQAHQKSAFRTPWTADFR